MTASQKLRIGVLVSGNGSNLQSLIDSCRQDDFPAQVALVLSDVAEARALDRARSAGIPCAHLARKGFPDRAQFDRALAERLQEARVEWVLLAGFMRILGRDFLDAFPARVLNIHPALLPAFPGLHAVRQAIRHGVRISGCTVHRVDEGVDTGPILAQAAVPVLPEDTEATLAARIQAQEHRLYPAVLEAVARRALGQPQSAESLLGGGALLSLSVGPGAGS